MINLTKWSFWATLFSLTLLPAVQLVPSIPAIQLDDVIPMGWLLSATLILRWQLLPAAQCRALLMVLFAALIPVSIANGIANGYGGSYADLNQIIRILKYLSVYLLAAVYFSQSGTQVWRVAWFAVPLFAICLTQYFNPFNINELYVRQIAPTQFVTLVNNYPEPRPVGMVGNPNDAGFLFTLLSLAGLFGALRHKSRTAAILSLVSIAGMLITLSRTAMMAFLVAAIIMVLIHQYSAGNLRRAMKWMGIAVASVIPIMLLPPIYSTFTLRFASVLDFANQASWSARVENWGENFNLALQHPTLGVGPLRRVIFEHAADNDWLLIFRSFGIVGVCIVILMIVLPSIYHEQKALPASLFAAIFINMTLSTVFFSLVLFPMALIIFASADSTRHRCCVAATTKPKLRHSC